MNRVRYTKFSPPNMHSMMATSFRSTRMQRAQKGDSGSNHQALPRRADNQGRGLGGCARQPGSHTASDEVHIPDQAHDMKGVAPLIEGISFDAVRAVKAFDADWLLQDLDTRSATAVIPPRANSKVQRTYDAEVYKWRHLVENYFAKIKGFRGIASRYDKTDCSYAASWTLIAALIASR